MHHQSTIRYCLVVLLLLATLPCFCQKIREKKDIVYVDDVPLYQYVRTKGGFAKEEHEKVVTTLSGSDTLVWMKYATYAMRKTDYEKWPYKDNYWEMRFAGTDSIIWYKTSGNLAYHDLVKSGVLKAGRLDLSALPALQQECYPYLTPIRTYQLADAHRQKLGTLPGYADYVKRLAKRSADNILHVEQGSIFYQNKVGASPEHIGKFDQGASAKGTEYRIYRSSDKEQVATILVEGRTGAASIKTRIDNASYDYMLSAPFDNVMLTQAVQYLVWNGYL